MLPRVIIIEHSSAPMELSCLRFLSTQAQFDRQTWENTGWETLSRSHAKLIILHALPETELAFLFFRCLRDNPITIPTLAVLPESPDSETMRVVPTVTDDFVLAPLREEELKLRVLRILGSQSGAEEQARNELSKEVRLANLVGNHPLFLQAVHQVLLFAGSRAPVLITGETGTGKEVFARAIHSLSESRDGPFIPLDCGALPEHLAENELFGHCRGAFTDAHKDQKGLAAMAEGGTLFLDEIDALSLANQVKLLRFLQEGTYRALGADRFNRANVRVIAATNRCIEDAVRQQQFRADLYFRINVLRLQLPPLRQRPGDISVLARHFLVNECVASSSGQKSFSAAALQKLEAYHWPGNLRELLNAIQRASVCCQGHQILPRHISLQNEASDSPERPFPGDSFRSAKRGVIERFERSYIEGLLSRHGGNITQAAHEAGKERRAFGRLVKKYGLHSGIAGSDR